MTQQLELTARKLYIVAGISGTGKSSLLAGLKEFVVSTDALRDQILGSWTNAEGRLHRHDHQDVEVFEILYRIVGARARERLTTFVDATNLREADRQVLAKIAAQHGQAAEVLFLDAPLELALERNSARVTAIPEHAIRRQHAVYERQTSLPSRTLDMARQYQLSVVPDRIPDIEQIDAIGDVHGMYDELQALLRKLGYEIADGGAPVHPDGRKLLFVGDVVDRGPKSLEVLELVYRAVKAGHYAICGNHETKLVRFWQARQRGESAKLSLSASETAMAFAKLPQKDQDRLGRFLLEMPRTYVWRNFGFAHADLVHYDPIRTPASDLMFGASKLGKPVDSDELYCQQAQAGVNRYILVRGHIEPTSGRQRRHVLSLEARQAYRGELVALDVAGYQSQLNRLIEEGADVEAGYLAAYQGCTTAHATSFDFDENVGARRDRMKGLSRLQEGKLALCAEDASGTLRLWKYSKQVFWDKLWSQDPLLLKARGLVLDLAGNVVAHPFDKVFNYGEEGAALEVPDDEEVLAVEKLNGFLGVVSPHPHAKRLLPTTTGSFDSPFVGYINTYLPGPVAGRVLQYFHRNGPLTLMFEVLHPEDPHIIEYAPEMHGLWLIGARRLDWDAKVLPEEELDTLAAELGFRRPAVERMTFGEVKARTVESRTEGFMVRTADTQDYLCKLKTPYYLTTKFLGRLGDGKAKFLFKNPQEFKRSVDEEFFPIVDWLAATYTVTEFLAMSEADRLTALREFIRQQMA